MMGNNRIHSVGLMVPVNVWYDGRRAGAQSNPDMVDVDATWGSVEARWTPRGDRGAGEGVWFCRRNGNRQSRTETAVWIIITRLVVTFRHGQDNNYVQKRGERMRQRAAW